MKLLILIIIFGAFGIQQVKADIIYSQTTSNEQTAEFGETSNQLPVQQFNLGKTWTLGSITIKIQPTVATTTQFRIAIQGNNSAQFGGGACTYTTGYWLAGYGYFDGTTNIQTIKVNLTEGNLLNNTTDPRCYWAFSVQSTTTKAKLSGNDLTNASTTEYAICSNPFNCNPDVSLNGINDFFYIIQDNTTDTYTPIQTEFTDLYPNNNDIVLDPLVPFSAEWFITNTDIAEMDSFFGWLNGNVRIQATIQDPYNSNWSCQIYTEDFDINTLTTTFNYTFDGTNTLCPNADYNRDYKIIWRMVGTNGLNNMAWSYSTSTYFTVGTTEWEGNINTFVASSTQNKQAQKKHLLIDEGVCLPVFGDFDLSDCILLIIWPDPEFTASELGEIGDKIQTVFPIGIITDFRQIISTTTVGTLAIIDTDLPSALGMGTPHITLDLTNVLDPFLNATTGVFTNTTTASSTDTLYTITYYYWRILCILGFMFYIVTRILGERFALTGMETGRRNYNRQQNKKQEYYDRARSLKNKD